MLTKGYHWVVESVGGAVAVRVAGLGPDDLAPYEAVRSLLVRALDAWDELATIDKVVIDGSGITASDLAGTELKVVQRPWSKPGALPGRFKVGDRAVVRGGTRGEITWANGQVYILRADDGERHSVSDGELTKESSDV